MKNINNPNLKVTTFKELGFRNRWKQNHEIRNRHFIEIEEDIMEDLNSDFSKNVGPTSKSLNSTPDKRNSKYLPKHDQSGTTIRFGNKLKPKEISPIKSAVSRYNNLSSRSKQMPKDEPFILLDYHKPIQFTGNPFNKTDLYYNPFKKPSPAPEPITVT
jgi:hypothetical protein